MKNILTFLPFFILATLNSRAQNIAWQKCIDSTGLNCIQQTNDGGYIIAGASTTFLIAKTDENGNISWKTNLDGNNGIVNSIKQTSDGGYILAGSSSSNQDGLPTYGGQDYWIAKTDATGNIQWQKSMGGSNDDIAYSVDQTTDGGYIIGGYTSSFDGDVVGNHGNDDYWIIKLDNSGVLQWKECLGGSDYDEAYSIKSTNDGGCIIAGKSKSFDGDVTGIHGGNQGIYDYWIVKLNSTGTISWQKCFGGSNTDLAYSIDSTSDGGYIIGGTANSSDGDAVNNNHPYDFWIIKINNAGIIQWQKSMGGSDEDEVHSIKSTSDGGYIVAGWTYSNDGDVIGSHGYVDFWIIKLGSTGNVLWKKCLGGGNGDYVNSIIPTSDGGYTLVGTTYSYDGDVIRTSLPPGPLENLIGGGWIVHLNSGILPVIFINFSGNAQNNKNILYWTTTEINNEGFEIDRSNDGINFNRIGFVNSKSKGIGNEVINYDFIDENLSSGTNYYRLKQVYKDGQSSYSKIISINNDKFINPTLFSLFPNPTINILNIRTTSPRVNEIKLAVVDVSGNILIKKEFEVNKGESITSLDITKLPKATYFLKVTLSAGKEIYIKKFEKVF